MSFSKFSEQLKAVCGGVFLILGYTPILFNLFELKEVNSKSNVISNNICNEILFNTPIFESKLTDELKNLYLAKLSDEENLEKKFNDDNSIKLIKSYINKCIKEIESGPFKGGKLVKGKIISNFYADACKLSVPAKVIDKVINSLSEKIDFRRSLKKGDIFEIAFNDKKELLYSKIRTKRKEAAIYKFGKEGYFFENGEKALSMKGTGAFGVPMKGRLKVSSPFGIRYHPVFKVRRMHKGVDFCANYGTPVYAIYDGVVTRASAFFGYGKCVDIKHRSGYSSRYGHLSRYTVKPGAHVRKGQLIAYSGSTGVSTAPHLHLELARNNVNINPLSVKMIPERVERVSNNHKFNNLKNYIKNL